MLCRMILYALCFLVHTSPVAFATKVIRQACLDSVCYFIPPDHVLKLDSALNISSAEDDELLPISVVNLDLPDIGNEDILSALAHFDAIDDVWSPSFAAYIYIQHNAKRTQRASKGCLFNISFDVGIVLDTSGVQETPLLPEGPYFLDANTKKLFKAYRLYDDIQQTFLQSSYQSPSGSHQSLIAGAAGAGAGSFAVAVPSRIHYTKTPEQPLAGVRIGIQDVFDLKGMKTSGGNRAYFSMTETTNKTAPAVQKLIDAGAVIVGKNKLTEFSWAGAFETDHIDYHLPFNPRGDGYLISSDGTNGGAASIASYDWLDLAVGTDSGGAVRGPAQYTGVHGNRPTSGSADLEGVITFSTTMETIGVLARDPLLWADATDILYGDKIQDYTSFPATVLANVEDLPGTDELYQTKIEDIYWKFGLDLADAIGAQVSNFTNLDDIWHETRPAELGDASFFETYNPLYRNLSTYEQATKFGLAFISAYKAAHNGALPYVAPQILSRWELSTQNIDEETYQNLLGRKAAISRWASENLFKADPESCTDSLLITYYGPPLDSRLVLSKSDLNPSVSSLFAQVSALTAALQACRGNTTSSSSSPPTPANIFRLVSLADMPMLILTLGEFASDGDYTYSNITRQKQTLPYSVGLTTRKRCDFVLSRIVRVLVGKGIVRTVAAGASVEGGSGGGAGM